VLAQPDVWKQKEERDMTWLGNHSRSLKKKPRQCRQQRLRFEKLEDRRVMAADPLPVLMVLADRQDFYFQEYNDTRIALEAEGFDVVVAATTTNPTTPHPGSGQGWNSGVVVPDIALASVDADDYSAIVFVGGWGASMYQYAYNDPNGDGITDNYYANDPYNGDPDLNDGQIAAQKVAVNNLIGEFIADDKYVAALCHGVTVLAWARVDGASPIAGRHVAVPTTVSAPTQFYNGQWRTDGYYLGQYDQVIDNGGIASPVSGSIGDPNTVADDVVVDGKIITAENFHSALQFGHTLGQQILASVPPDNQPPVVTNALFVIAENSATGTLVGQVEASDPDAGQSLVYSIVGGNIGNAFTIDSATGVLRVATPGALDFETLPIFELTIQVMDSGSPGLIALGTMTVELTNVVEAPVTMIGNDLVVQGTANADTIYLWSGASPGTVYVWLNGQQFGPFSVATNGRVHVFAGGGNDQVFATDLRVSASIFGEGGHDLITGGWANDLLDGGDGVDRLWANQGDDLLRGGAGDDYLFGREGNDLLLGGDGNDYLDGFDGADVLIGGLGSDRMDGGSGDDLLIGGRTSYDNNDTALWSLLLNWTGPGPIDPKTALLSSSSTTTRLRLGETVFDDGSPDVLIGNAGADWFFANLTDHTCSDVSDRPGA
jgi:putative intracellular protease/amidase